MGMHLGMPRNSTRPYWELAARIEQGVDELHALREKGELASHLMIDQSMEDTVAEVLDTGSCTILNNLESRIERMAETEIEGDVRMTPDEFT